MHRIRSLGAASRRRTARSAAASMTCSQLSKMIAVSLRRESFDEGGLAAGHVQRGDHGVDDVVGGRRHLQSGQPDATGPSAGLRPVAIATAVLPTPPGPTISTSRRVASSSVTVSDDRSRPTSSVDIDGRFPTGVATVGGDASSGGWRSSEASWVRIWCCELLQLRSWVEAELVGQQVPDPLVGGQGVGLASASVQRRDQQRPQALLVRVWWRLPLPTRRSLQRHRPTAGGPRTRSRGVASATASSRARCGVTQSPSPAPVRTSPRYVCSVDAHSSAARLVVAGVEQSGRGGCRGATRPGRRRRQGRRRACSRRRR